MSLQACGKESESGSALSFREALRVQADSLCLDAISFLSLSIVAKGQVPNLLN